MEPLSNRTELGSSNLNGNPTYENGYTSTIGQSPTRGKTFGAFGSGYGSTGFGGIGSAIPGGQGQGGQDRTGFRDGGNGIQRSRSPGIYSGAIGSGTGGQGRETGTGGSVQQQQSGSSIPNGRFLEIGQSFPPGISMGMGGASKLGGINDNAGGFGGGYSGNVVGAGAGHQRIPTSPSSVGRSSDRVFGSTGSTDSTMLGGLQDKSLPSQFSMSQNGEVDFPDHQSEDYNSFARRSPRPETNDRNGAFEGARKLWNATPAPSAPSGGQAGQGQIIGPASLGGTPTRVNGGGSRPGVERTHSRFGQATGNLNGNGAGIINQGILSNGPLGVAGLGGLERPTSAMSVKGGGVTSVGGGGVAGITDASGRMEGQALIDLIARVGRTEAAIADLGQQVASLNTIVKSLQISANQNGSATATLPAPSGLGSNSGSNSSSGGSTPSVFGPPAITRTSASNKVVPVTDAGETPTGGALTAGTIESSSTITPTAAAVTSTPDVAALTHQIAALSASVAQLQKMQSMAVRQGLEKRMGQSGASSPEERTGVVPSAQQTGNSNSPPGSSAAPTGNQQPAVQTPNQTSSHNQQGYFPAMSANNGRPHNARNQTGPASGMNNSIASALGSIGSRPRPHPSRAASSSVVPGAALGNGGQGYQHMAGATTTASERLSGAPNGMSLGPMNLLSPGPGGRIERDRLEAVTPGGMSREGGPGGMTVTKWEHLPLTPELQRQIIKYGIGPPNKIQARALPFMLRGSDIIAQAPPTQERIITYVIPVVQLVMSLGVQQQPTYKGPCAIIVTTTVDQATQAHKLIRDIGAPLGVRTGLAVGASGADISADLANWHRNAVHVLVGTPARLNDVMVKHSNNGGLPGGDVRLLVLDEVDQLIARNLYENVTSICRVLPAPRSRNPTAGGVNGVIGTPGPQPSPAITSPFDAGMSSPFNPASAMPFPASTNSRFNPAANPSMGLGANPERQTCIFSNTIPTDVINFSQSIQVREPVRVLVRREGGTNASQESTSSGNLRHYYLYLALAGGAASRNDAAAAGPGTIGSGRAAGNQNTEVNQAKEFKLEALADLLLEYPLWQAIIHVGAQSTLDAVTSKLNSRQMDNLSLSPDMTAQAKQAVYGKWRASAQSGRGPRFLVAFDTIVKPPEVVAAPLVINFDLPRSVEGYAQRVSAANQADANRNDRNRNGPAPSSIVLNFIQAAGGDVEMLRSTECAYRFKCSEIPASFRDLF